MQKLILASGSPRRVELLRLIGIEAEVVRCDVPEQPGAGESPAAYSRRVARAKASAGREAYAQQFDRLVLGADTEVLLDGHVFGKPQDAQDAMKMLALLSGREHEVLSSVALIGPAFDEVISCSTAVRFAKLSQGDMEAYVASGEPFGKAGAYAIQGRAATFIEHIHGSYWSVMGLPLFETAALLRRAGFCWESSAPLEQ